MKTYRFIRHSFLGDIYIFGSVEEGITQLDFNPTGQFEEEASDSLLDKAALRLQAYLEGEVVTFEDIPLNPEGTPFQTRVWQALQTIPRGGIRSYKWLAESVGNPAACRAVGNANGKNPIPILIPCHRVIQQNGSLGGYTGGLHIKRYLLNLEGFRLREPADELRPNMAYSQVLLPLS